MNREFLIRKKLDFLPTTKGLVEQIWRTSVLGFIGALKVSTELDYKKSMKINLSKLGLHTSVTIWIRFMQTNNLT